MAKSKLDRKTRRAIEQAVRQQVVGGTSAVAKKVSKTNAYWSTSGITITGNTIVNGSLGSAKACGPNDMIELPPITGELYVSSYELDDLLFHLKVANKLSDVPNWTTVCRRSKGNEVSFEQLAFYSEADRTTFETWMDAYLGKFGDYTDLMLPAPIDGVYPHTVRSNFERQRAASSNHNTSSDSTEDQMLEQWLWILENCEDEVRHAGAFWFFANIGDATLFKMAYS